VLRVSVTLTVAVNAVVVVGTSCALWAISVFDVLAPVARGVGKGEAELLLPVLLVGERDGVGVEGELWA